MLKDTGKIFAVGDIHGCLDKLLLLMDKIVVDPEKDVLVFLGDYIDRGPNSFEVVEYLIGLKKRFQNIVFLKGNHEEMLEKYLAGPDRYTYIANGGRQTLESYLGRSKPDGPPIPREHLDFYESLSLYYQTGEYIFVHAGIRGDVPVEMQSAEDILWIREGFIHSSHDFGKRVVFGHTPFPEPLIQPNKIGIDTGAVYGNRLTCVKLPDLDFIAV